MTLASTHDTEALLPVIVHTAVEAAGATGARLMRDDVEVMRSGGRARRRRRWCCRSAMTMTAGRSCCSSTRRQEALCPRRSAEWFVSQAAIALENARLHGIVKRQAITDPLTGLYNRRRFVEALEAELSRAERFATSSRW